LKIVVTVKQVPDPNSTLTLESDHPIARDKEVVLDPGDECGVEEGLQLKEAHGGEVVVLCAGPDRAGQTIREALAKGADRAIHIETEEGWAADPLELARIMAKALTSEKPDLILTGLQSDDLGYGQTGVVLAEVMGLPHATIIMSIEASGGSIAPAAPAIKVKRELEDGWFQHVEMPLPALLTIQSGATKLRYATLMGIKKAKSKEVKRLAAADLAGGSTPSISIQRIYMPEKSKHSQIFDGPPKEAAAQLVEKLRFEARVI